MKNRRNWLPESTMAGSKQINASFSSTQYLAYWKTLTMQLHPEKSDEKHSKEKIAIVSRVKLRNV